MSYVTVGERGKIVRTVHDGTIPVNGGRAMVRTMGGVAQVRVRAPCDTCGAHYFFWRASVRRKYRCPACWAAYDRRKALARIRADPAAHREAQKRRREADVDAARARDRAAWHRRQARRRSQ